MSSTLYPAETNGDTVTSFIPLTTAWPSSSGCASYFRLNGPSLMAYDPGYGLDIDKNVVCAPPAVTTWWEQGLLGGGRAQHTAVSIGPLTCPEDFSTVVSSIKNGSSTLAMCCPSNYYLADATPGRVGGNCLSDVSSGMILTYASTPYGVSTAWKTVTTTLSRSSTVGAIAVVGWNIRFAATTPITTSSISTSTTTPDTSSAIDTSAPTSTSGGDLSLSAKVGIGVGVAVGALGVISLLVAFYFFTQRTQRTSRTTPDPPEPDPQQPVMFQMNSQPAWPVELDGTKHRPGEGAVSPAELAG